MDSADHAAIDFDIRFLKKGKRSVVLALPPTYHGPIGLVITYWGLFEGCFDSCLSGLIEGEVADSGARDTAGWQRRSFESRRKLLKDICNEWLSSWKPDAAHELIRIIDRSGDLSAKRNSVAHGTFRYTIPPHSSKAVNVRAVNPSTGKEWPITVDKLKKLYHDISHLTCDLHQCFSSFAEMQGPFHAIEDKEILRAYSESIRSSNPNPNKLQLPPVSSQE